MSKWMVQSEITRIPNPKHIDYNTQWKWNYTHGLELQSMLQCADQYPELKGTVEAYATLYCDSIIAPDGTIRNYRKTNYTLDHINAGKMVFMMLDRTGDRRFKKALDTLYSQLQTHPRVTEGGFWHKKAYPHQMWLDGIYMEAPFYAEYAKRFLKGRQQQEAFTDVVNQFMVVARHTFDASNGLYRHAWDEAREQAWADKTTGQAPHVWGRALGWFTMAMVDTYAFLPADHSGRDSIASILLPLCEQLMLVQDEEAKAWYQVMDAGQRDGNYLETSCTAMFAYTFLKGVRLGILPEAYWQQGVDVLDGLDRYFIREDADKTISLTRVCGVAGLGGNPYRDGTFDYYVNEIIRDNDPKGVAPYIMAHLMVEQDGRNRQAM